MSYLRVSVKTEGKHPPIELTGYDSNGLSVILAKLEKGGIKVKDVVQLPNA